MDVTLDSTLWDEDNRTDVAVKSTSLRGKGWITADYATLLPTLHLTINDEIVFDSISSWKTFGLDSSGCGYSIIHYANDICRIYIQGLKRGKFINQTYKTISLTDDWLVFASKREFHQLIEAYPDILKSSFISLVLRGFKRTMGTDVDTTCAVVIPFVRSQIEVGNVIVNDAPNSRFDFIALANGKAYLRDVDTNNVVDLNAPGVDKHTILLQVCEAFKKYANTIDVTGDTQRVRANIAKKGSVRSVA